MSTKKISIITVTYNSEKHLAECIESIKNQTYNNIEYIVVDGNSSDSTCTIIKNHNKDISKWISEPDTGIYEAMNKGINLASGEVIGILNSDDLFADNTVIENVMECFYADPELEILYGNLVYVSKNDTTKVIRKWTSKPYYDKFFESGNVPPHPALFLRKEIYQDAGVFDLRYKLAADYEFMLRIFKKFKYKTKYINRLMVKMRLGGATNKSVRNVFNGNKEIISAWKHNGFKFPLLFMPQKIAKRLVQFYNK